MVFSHSGSSPSLRNCVTATQDSDGSTIESPARMIRIICTWTARFVFSGLRAVTSEMSCNITHFYRPHIEPTTEMGICHARILLHALHLLQKSPSRFILQIAIEAENQGAFGVVVNAPISNEVISRIKEVVDIPVIATIVSDQMDIGSRIEAGADFLNVSGAAATPQIVRRIRAQFPNIPILATGGPNDETILETIHAGANAITYSPPSNGELFAAIMQKYREKL